ncbi:MFS transporter [bacterium]|nr:MFS transporter [bacterium]
MNHLKKLLLAVFFVHFANELLNIGLIVKLSSLTEGPIKKTVLVITIQTLAVLFAILLKSRLKKLDIRKSTLATLFFMLPCWLSPELGLIWTTSLFFRVAFGYLALSQIMAMLPNLCEKETIAAENKKMQLWTTVSNALAYGVAPFAGFYLEGASIYYGNLILIAIACVLVTLLPQSQNEKCEKQSIFAFTKTIRPRSISLIHFMVWIACGVFYILEVPLLTKQANLSAEDISIFFLASFATNFIAVKFVPEKFFDKYASGSYFTLATCTLVICGTYLMSSSYWTVLILIMLIGAITGPLSLTLNTRVQKLSSARQREDYFLWYRVLIELGILGGAGIVFALQHTNNPFNSVAQVCFTLAGAVFVFGGFLKFDPMRYEPIDSHLVQLKKEQ